MIHYHGLPITPNTACVEAINCGHAFISHRHKSQLNIAIEISQSFAVDNGAFSAWRSGNPITDWSEYYSWVNSIKNIPNFDFAVIPDVIDGDEQANDALIDEWPFKERYAFCGAPVWHMHESIVRLQSLAHDWPRVCIGSSGDFARVGNYRWWKRISEVMIAICDDNGTPCTKIHGLRMLNPDVFSKLPLSSADSCNIAMNIGIDKAWKGPYSPPSKESRALILRKRIESQNSISNWDFENRFIENDVFDLFV